MSFSVGADAYDQFMGTYSGPLARPFADFAAVGSGPRVLDVGCGPGALTGELISRVGAAQVFAVDPSESFVDAAQQRFPGVDVRQAGAEELPFDDGAFDAALAQLVVQFMPDPVAGLREMRRVTRPQGVVAACVWDHGGGHGPLSIFWQAAREVDPDVEDEAHRAGARQGHLAQLLEDAQLRDIEEASLSVDADYATFEDWWYPYTLGVGTAGGYAANLTARDLASVRDHCRNLLPAPPFTITAEAWAARGIV